MKPEDSFDDFLAQHLRQPREYLLDDGFTAQVMAALPQQKSKSYRAEALIIGLPLFIISSLVFSQFPFATFGSNLWYFFAQIDVAGWLTVGVTASATIMLIGVMWFWQTAESW
jgi:hypothetical protein